MCKTNCCSQDNFECSLLDTCTNFANIDYDSNNLCPAYDNLGSDLAKAAAVVFGPIIGFCGFGIVLPTVLLLICICMFQIATCGCIAKTIIRNEGWKKKIQGHQTKMVLRPSNLSDDSNEPRKKDQDTVNEGVRGSV
jgi:hypothetical protein